MDSLGVVDGLEVRKGRVEFGQGLRCGPGIEPFLHRLLKAFDFALGLRVVAASVALGDVVGTQQFLEAIDSAAEPAGVDHAVVGQGRCRPSVLFGCGGEGGHDSVDGRGCVGTDVQCGAGVIIEPGDDVDPVAVEQAVVGDVGLPATVGQVRFEAGESGFGFLLRLCGDESFSGENAGDRGPCGDGVDGGRA